MYYTEVCEPSVMVHKYRSCDIVSNLFHLIWIQVRDHICHSIIMISLITSISTLCNTPTWNVIVVMCSNKVVKNHCNNKDVILSAYIKGWHTFQNFPSILPNSKSSFYDWTKWGMEIIKSLLWMMQLWTSLKIGDVLPLPLIWCKEPCFHWVSWINKIIFSCKRTRLLY